MTPPAHNAFSEGTPGALSGENHCFDLLDAIGTPILAHREGAILFINRALEALSGYQRSDFAGAPHDAIIHPDSRALAQQQLAAATSSDSPPPACELRLETSDKSRQCWVELTLSIIQTNGMNAVIASFYDLTERRKADFRQRQMRQLFSQIIEGDPVPTFVLDRHHQVTHWNHACTLVTGVAASEVVGTTRQWLPFYPSERPVMADLILDGAVGGGTESHLYSQCKPSTTIAGAFEAESFFPQFKPHGRWLYFTAAPLRDTSGQIIGAIETLQDVTARHEAEDELRRHHEVLEALVLQRTSQLDQANEQLMHSDKMASIGQLAAGVAHEINNPIGFVHSNIGALGKYVDDLFSLLETYQNIAETIIAPEHAATIEAKHREIDLEFLKEDIPMLLRESRDGITRVKQIVQNLKDFSHVDRDQEWQLADLHKGIDSTINIVANELKYKADVVKNYGNLPEIECLPSQLNQVFMNLLVNAAHAMGEERGQITIRTGVEGNPDTDPESATVWLEFEDNASGIPEAILAKIFDPFFTTKPIGQGTGLGLSLSYGIIKKHGGSLTAKSTLGQGTTFRIVLPVKHVEAAES